ncbi:unnamed protein product, partial [Allacma fusca]
TCRFDPNKKKFGDEICGSESSTGICLNTTVREERGGSSDGQCWNNDVCCKSK